jgi:ADP-ribosylglycohydrolase
MSALSEAFPAPAEAIDATIVDRIGGALWGLLIADALAMPTHWYYDGHSQICDDYHGPLTGYVTPKYLLRGSIMNKSNTGGGGRGGFEGNIIGGVINHGKKKFWDPQESYHYHCTLRQGENTLDAQLVRLVIRAIGEQRNRFSEDSLRSDYVKFMTTPGSHNDAYASTTHRMFFANRARGLSLKKCPDNDQKNVDTLDGLLMIVPVCLAYHSQSAAKAEKTIGACIGATRKSKACVKFGVTFDSMLRQLLHGVALARVLEEVAESMILNLESSVKRPDPVSP